jgi:succinate dehydrogenase/fumarate reductase flavoprotein subunit
VEKSVEKLAGPLGRKEGISPISIRKKVQKLMYQNVGIMRNEKGLKETIKAFEEIEQKELPKMKVSPHRIFNYEWAESIKVRNMARAALVISRSALFREESRGVHFREDFPKKDKNWLLNVNAKMEKGEIKIFKTPLVINKNHTMEPQG